MGYLVKTKITNNSLLSLNLVRKDVVDQKGNGKGSAIANSYSTIQL